MKRKAYTKAQVKRLIREIAKVTQQKDVTRTGAHFAALLSSMRGPDVEEDNMQLKDDTTMVIRSKLGWRCGMMGDSATKLDVVSSAANRAISRHFSLHITDAITALEYFGYGDKQDEGGEKA